MIRTAIYGLLIIFLYGTYGCKSQEPMMISHPDRIEFGSFGGFAGSYTEYKVVPDGHAWKQERHKGDIINLQQIDPSVIEQMTSLLSQSKSSGYAINNPGNMTYFIRLCQDGAPPYELIWGGGEIVDEKIKSIHRSLTKLCKEDHPVR